MVVGLVVGGTTFRGFGRGIHLPTSLFLKQMWDDLQSVSEAQQLRFLTHLNFTQDAQACLHWSSWEHCLHFPLTQNSPRSAQL